MVAEELLNEEENPTQGWAWNDEGGYFMRPGILFTNRWSPVQLDFDQQKDPRYRYDPSAHPIYRNVVQAQNDAGQAQQAQNQYESDRQRAQENAGRLAYWGRHNEAQRLTDDFNRKYNLYAGSGQPQSTKGIRQATLPGTPVMPQDNTRVKSPVIRDSPEVIKRLAENKNSKMSGTFDGSIFRISRDNGDVIHSESYPAVAGRPDGNGKFDYSPERQKMPDGGPIPEGTYWINPQVINESPAAWSAENIGNIGAGVLKAVTGIAVGPMPGGRPAWGAGHVQINPTKVVVDGVKRGGFTVHGGNTPGSNGCIDLTGNDGKFFDFLKKHRGGKDSIPIFVEYPKTKTGK